MVDWSGMRTSDAFDVEGWGANGFSVSRSPWLAAEVASLRSEYDRLLRDIDMLDRPPVRYGLEDPQRQNNLEMLSHAHWSSDQVDRIARSTAFGRWAAELLDVPRVRLWGTSFIGKSSAAEARNSVSWHRDMSFWQCLSAPRLLTFWVALDAVSVINGSMEFAVASHRAEQASAAIDDDLDTFATCCVAGPAGTVSVHHCLTGHRSGCNRSGGSRVALTLHYMDADLHYVAGTLSDNHINVPLIAQRNGNRLDDAYFPVVYQDA